MGFWLAGAAIWARFDHWLSLNHLVGFGRSIEFKISGTINEMKTIFIFYIFFRKPKKLCSDIDINNMLGNNDMVSKIFYSIDRSNLTKWFRLNQWSNRAHITAPASQKPKFCNYEKKFEIAWDMYDFWGPKAKSAPDLKNEKFWKLLGCTKYV